jgi:hypothetical protein
MPEDEKEIPPRRLTAPHSDVQVRDEDGQMALETAAPLRDDATAAVECTGDPKPTDRILHSTHFDNRQFSRAIRDVTVPNPRTESNAA